MEQFEVDQKDRGLRRKEFGYMIGILLGTYPVDRECKFCLVETRKNIADFYEFVDCDKDSLISAQNIHR